MREGHRACRKAVRSVSAAPKRTRSAECTDPSAARDTPKIKPKLFNYTTILIFEFGI
ncbi:MAG: hypothetical protein NZ455_00600 [Bacteroidia bacterium]|nr:hypothetical protein [Bacteroidia bacterium]MDW8347036.1 hypothetical protein [Bacteroidia bacterium]